MLLAEKTFDADGMSLNYVEGPPGGQPVVMLHGVTNRWHNFMPVLPLFGWGYHAYALDQRGHGHSGRAIDGYQSSRFAHDVVQFLQGVVRQPVVLLGHSLGAMITLQVAAEAPDAVKAIVLGDPPLFNAADGGGTIPPWFQQYLDLMMSDGSREEKLSNLTNITRETEPDVDGAAIQAHLRCLELLDPEVLVTGAEARLFTDLVLADVLPRIQCSVLLIQGNPALGGVVSDSDAERALNLLPQSTHIYVADMGHNLQIPQPNTFFSIVSNSIEGLA